MALVTVSYGPRHCQPFNGDIRMHKVSQISMGERRSYWDGPKMAPVGIGDTIKPLYNLAMEEQREIALQRGEGGEGRRAG